MIKISTGTAHALPRDLQQALSSRKSVLEVWETLTPLARNEWICWVESVKKDETRVKHITRLVQDLKSGKRRPCCWMGCTHRKDKPLSSSQKYILSKKS